MLERWPKIWEFRFQGSWNSVTPADRQCTDKKGICIPDSVPLHAYSFVTQECGLIVNLGLMLLADVIRLHFAIYLLWECNYMELRMVCGPFWYALHGAGPCLDHANKNWNTGCSNPPLSALHTNITWYCDTVNSQDTDFDIHKNECTYGTW